MPETPMIPLKCEACRYQKLVRSEILEDSVAAGHAGRIMLNVLRSLAGAARSFLRTQRELALKNLALRHQVGVLKRTVGNRRLAVLVTQEPGRQAWTAYPRPRDLQPHPQDLAVQPDLGQPAGAE